MRADIDKYLRKHSVVESNKHLYSGAYTNRTATGIASLDGSIQMYDNDIYVNGSIIVQLIA